MKSMVLKILAFLRYRQTPASTNIWNHAPNKGIGFNYNCRCFWSYLAIFRTANSN